jgi:succinoglycan biosynthesis protein ExoA
MATPADIRVSIVVPCRNEVRHIDRCLEGILSQEGRGEDWEVLVADGQSDDGTRERIEAWAARHPSVRLIDNPGRIASAGLNAAIRAARGDFVLRLDAHTEFAPDYVRQCLAVLAETGADNVGGPARTRAEGYLQRAVAAAFHSRFSTGGAGFHRPDYEGEVDTVVYGCWRRETLFALGLFDEELVRNQDDELNLRHRRRGGRLWQSPRIRSYYRPRASLAALFQQYRQYGYWKVRVIQKHRLPGAPRHLAPGLFVAGAAVGWMAGLVHWTLGAAYAAVLAAYLAIGGSFAVQAAARHGWDLLPVLPVVFATFHAGYGIGFLEGVWDFGIRRRRPRAQMTALTRDDGRALRRAA